MDNVAGNNSHPLASSLFRRTLFDDAYMSRLMSEIMDTSPAHHETNTNARPPTMQRVMNNGVGESVATPYYMTDRW